MGKSSGSQTTTQKTELPAWYTDAVKSNINFANTAANNLAQPYQGNTVAGLTDAQKKAIDLTGQNIGSTNAGYTAAGQTASNVAGYKPQNFLEGNVGAYMNPYIKNVEEQALSNLDRAYKQNINTIGDTALGAKAFGGSRHGVAEGVAAAENARQMGDLSAQLRSQGFQSAQGMMQSDMDRALSGQQLNLQGAEAQGTLAGQQQQAYLQSLNSALAAGQITQQQAQAMLDQQKAQWDAMREVPMEQLNMRTAALSGVQVPTSYTTKQPTTGNPLLSGLGAAGTILSGLGSLGVFSDENEKTNVQRLGVDGMTGLPVYAYDYKADVKAAKRGKHPMPPKRVGPMAQDVERRQPGATRRVGGKMVVNNLGFGG